MTVAGARQMRPRHGAAAKIQQCGKQAKNPPGAFGLHISEDLASKVARGPDEVQPEFRA
jgi:hypothetical protein